MVKYITYKGNKYPIRLSYRVFKGLKAELGEVILSKLESLDSAVLESMMWHGLISGHKFEQKEMTLRREDMEDVLDECMFEFMGTFAYFFPDTVGKLAPNLNAPKEEEKTSGAEKTEGI